MDFILLGLLVYLAITFAISILASRKIKGCSKNFIIAGGSLPLFLVIFAEMEQALDGNATLGVFNLTGEFGFWSAIAIPVGLGLSLILAGVFFAQRLREMNIITIADYYRLIFGRRFEIIASFLMVISFSILLGGNIAAVGSIVESLFLIPFLPAVVISVIFILLYTYMGGFFSDVVSDPLQVITFIIGIMSALILLFMDFGGSVFSHPTAYQLTQLSQPSQGAVINWTTIIALGLGDIIAVDFIARILAAQKTSYAKKGCIIGGIGVITIGILFAFFGVASQNIAPGSAIYEVLSGHFPALISVFVLGAILAASFSTADGAILGPASLFAKNIFGFQPGKKAGKDKLLSVTRIFTIIIAFIGAVIALRIPQPGILLTLAFDVVLCSLFASFVFGMYWKVNKKAAFVSLTIGAIGRLLTFIFTPTVYGVPNTLFFQENSLFTEAFDGYATLLPFGLSLLSYVLITATSNTSVRYQHQT